MALLLTGIALAIIGLGVLWFRYLLNIMIVTWSTTALNYAHCLNCQQDIHGCDHIGGVPSTWTHVATGKRMCLNGQTFADHA